MFELHSKHSACERCKFHYLVPTLPLRLRALMGVKRSQESTRQAAAPLLPHWSQSSLRTTQGAAEKPWEDHWESKEPIQCEMVIVYVVSANLNQILWNMRHYYIYVKRSSSLIFNLYNLPSHLQSFINSSATTATLSTPMANLALYYSVCCPERLNQLNQAIGNTTKASWFWSIYWMIIDENH